MTNSVFGESGASAAAGCSSTTSFSIRCARRYDGGGGGRAGGGRRAHTRGVRGNAAARRGAVELAVLISGEAWRRRKGAEGGASRRGGELLGPGTRRSGCFGWVREAGTEGFQWAHQSGRSCRASAARSSSVTGRPLIGVVRGGGCCSGVADLVASRASASAWTLRSRSHAAATRAEGLGAVSSQYG